MLLRQFARRNAPIPEAEKIVDSFVEVVPPGCGNDEAVNESRARWTREFSIAMDTLSEPLLNGAGHRFAASPG